MATVYVKSGSGVTYFASSTAYVVGNRIVPNNSDTGTNHLLAKYWVWECTTAGTTTTGNPVWPASVVQDTTAVTHGTATFTARLAGYSSGPTQDWTFAHIRLDWVVTGSTNTDLIWVSPNHDNVMTSAGQGYTWTAPGAFGLRILCANSDSGVPTGVGTGARDGVAVNAGMSLVGSFYAYGINFYRGTPTGGSVNHQIVSNSTTSAYVVLDNCIVQNENTNASYILRLGSSAVGDAFGFRILLKDTVISIRSNSAQLGDGHFTFQNCTLESPLAAPTSFFRCNSQHASGTIEFIDCDLTGSAYTNLIGTSTSRAQVKLVNCKLRTGANLLENSSETAFNTPSVYAYDCSEGNTHGNIAYYAGEGSVVTNSSVKLAIGNANQSWNVTTNSGVTVYSPLYTPWITKKAQAGITIQPYVEILRNDDSTSAFTDQEVWLEVSVKNVVDSTKSTLYTTRSAFFATPTNNVDSGLDENLWTGSSGLRWAGKLVGPSITPIADGHIKVRVCVGTVTAGKLYIDPQIRT